MYKRSEAQAMPQVESATGKPTAAGEPVVAGNPATVGSQLAVKRAQLWDHSFYLFMSLLVAVVVVFGFSRTVSARLIHPPSPPPIVLYFHAAVFTAWVVFFIMQSALVRTRNVKVHRKLGWFGLALGLAIPVVGIATAITMTRLRMREGLTDAAAFMIVPFFDIAAFCVAFGLAFCWRTRPEFHRRLILMASCALTAAAFGRFPTSLIPPNCFYAGVDVLILLGVMRDLLATKRVHPVYLYGLPLLMLGQIATVSTFVKGWPAWLRLAHAILG
jgi:hypothetical protein